MNNYEGSACDECVFAGKCFPRWPKTYLNGNTTTILIDFIQICVRIYPSWGGHLKALDISWEIPLAFLRVQNIAKSIKTLSNGIKYDHKSQK